MKIIVIRKKSMAQIYLAKFTFQSESVFNSPNKNTLRRIEYICWQHTLKGPKWKLESP